MTRKSKDVLFEDLRDAMGTCWLPAHMLFLLLHTYRTAANHTVPPHTLSPDLKAQQEPSQSMLLAATNRASTYLQYSNQAYKRGFWVTAAYR